MEDNRKHIYVIRGPEGVYVGETVNPKGRWTQHRLPSNSKRLTNPLYDSMARHGLGAFTYEVVAITTRTVDATEETYRDAVDLEWQVTRQFLEDGVRVYGLPEKMCDVSFIIDTCSD